MKRSMRLITKQIVDGQLRVDEGAHEITFRSVKGEADGTEQRACLCALTRDAARFTVVKRPMRCKGMAIMDGADRKDSYVGDVALSKHGCHRELG